jgi:hypothetical protein
MRYSQINYEVMKDTDECCKSMPELMEAIQDSIANQYMVAEEESIQLSTPAEVHTNYIVSGKRSFEAAKDYQGKKVAVLNYANNHSI